MCQQINRSVDPSFPFRDLVSAYISFIVLRIPPQPQDGLETIDDSLACVETLEVFGLSLWGKGSRGQKSTILASKKLTGP